MVFFDAEGNEALEINISKDYDEQAVIDLLASHGIIKEDEQTPETPNA